MQVKLERYSKVRASTFGLKRGARVAVIRAEGAIVGAASGPLGAGGTSINAQKVCCHVLAQLYALCCAQHSRQPR